jgi:hypothetical protein
LDRILPHKLGGSGPGSGSGSDLIGRTSESVQLPSEHTLPTYIIDIIYMVQNGIF